MIADSSSCTALTCKNKSSRRNNGTSCRHCLSQNASLNHRRFKSCTSSFLFCRHFDPKLSSSSHLESSVPHLPFSIASRSLFVTQKPHSNTTTQSHNFSLTSHNFVLLSRGVSPSEVVPLCPHPNLLSIDCLRYCQRFEGIPHKNYHHLTNIGTCLKLQCQYLIQSLSSLQIPPNVHRLHAPVFPTITTWAFAPRVTRPPLQRQVAHGYGVMVYV